MRLLFALLVAAALQAQTPGMAILLRQNGRTISEQATGVRELRTKAKIDRHTNFRLASVTKQFTAAAIMLLARDGKLTYDEPITATFPRLPAYARAITLRHLLNHTSGLPDYETAMDATPGRWTAEHQIGDREVLALLENLPRPEFAAGARWAYSNSGYVLLGLVIEQKSGMSYAQFLERRIFQPLRMRHTVAYIKGVNTVPNRAYGHTAKGDSFVETDQSSTSATLGDGGVYSSVADLAQWDDALENHSLLTAKEMEASLVAVGPKQYGFGWFLDPYETHPRMWHSGSTTGFRTVIERRLDDHRTVIILANRTDLDIPALALARLGR